jgi:hypothetical protein
MATPVMVNESNAGVVARTVRDGAVVGEHSVRRSPSLAKIAAALCAAQCELKNPVKNKQNPHFKNWYADLTAVLESILPVFTKHKLSVMQLPCELDDAPAMMTLIMHDSGEWVETVVKVRPVKLDPQSVGSAQSYAKRYALQSIAGIAAEDDDDGHAATQQPQKVARPTDHADGEILFATLMRSIISAKDEAILRTAFGAAFKAHESRQITEQQYRDIETAKDEKKKQIARSLPVGP